MVRKIIYNIFKFIRLITIETIIFLLFLSCGGSKIYAHIYQTYQANNIRKELTTTDKTQENDAVKVFYDEQLDILKEKNPELYNMMAFDGWTINIVNSIEEEGIKAVKSDIPDLVTAGVTVYKDKLIDINAQYSSLDVFWHEVGHVLDVYSPLRNFLKDVPEEEWQNLIFHDKDFLEYINSTRTEQIAQAFYEFTYYPEEMKETSPNIYAAYVEANKYACVGQGSLIGYYIK